MSTYMYITVRGQPVTIEVPRTAMASDASLWWRAPREDAPQIWYPRRPEVVGARCGYVTIMTIRPAIAGTFSSFITIKSLRSF